MVEYYPEAPQPPQAEEVDAPMPHFDPDELEEIEDVSEAEKRGDPLRFSKIKRLVDGVEHIGIVEDIEKGTTTGDRLYRIKYSDGDFEHLTALQVVELKYQEEGTAPSGMENDDLPDNRVRQIADDEESLVCAPTFNMLKRPASITGNSEAPKVLKRPAVMPTAGGNAVEVVQAQRHGCVGRPNTSGEDPNSRRMIYSRTYHRFIDAYKKEHRGDYDHDVAKDLARKEACRVVDSLVAKRPAAHMSPGRPR